VSSTPVRDRTPSRSLPDRPGTASRHRKPAPAASPWRGKVARITAAALAGLALLVAAGPTAIHWLAGAPSLAWVDQADALGAQLAASLGVQVRQQPEIVSVGLAYGYLNPLRDVSGLVPERIDMGVDFNGSGPVYAVGDAVVTNASGDNFGWPGGGWITYQLTDGPDAGLMVYVAEDITPAVQVGQQVTTSTVVGIMHEGGDGIETGWAQASGLSAESQLPEAGGIGGFGPFPTRIGANFDQLLVSLGAPAASNLTEAASGLLPPNYPENGG
jgi:murein DD-endopeptidase MepM/ murein hydrolase activator NlpD